MAFIILVSFILLKQKMEGTNMKNIFQKIPKGAWIGAIIGFLLHTISVIPSEILNQILWAISPITGYAPVIKMLGCINSNFCFDSFHIWFMIIGFFVGWGIHYLIRRLK